MYLQGAAVVYRGFFPATTPGTFLRIRWFLFKPKRFQYRKSGIMQVVRHDFIIKHMHGCRRAAMVGRVAFNMLTGATVQISGE